MHSTHANNNKTYGIRATNQDDVLMTILKSQHKIVK